MIAEISERWRRRVRKALADPGYILPRLSQYLYEVTHPGEPWIAAGATRYCERRLSPAMQALEWGSGRSTLWFARRVGRLTSVEHDSVWHGKMMLSVSQVGNVDYRLIPVEHPITAPTYRQYEPQPKYVGIAEEFRDASLDFIVVDGHYRQACVRAAAPKLKPGGLILIDNWDRMDREEWGVPVEFELVHLSSNAMTHTAIWQKP